MIGKYINQFMADNELLVPGRLKAINKAIELAVKGWNRRDGRKANG